MGEIYSKETNTFDFGEIVIHYNLSSEEIFTKFHKSINSQIDCNNGIKVFVFKQIKLNGYYYQISVKINKENIIDCFTIQINDKFIIVPKNWEEYSEEEENNKLNIEKEWLKKEDIKKNDRISVLASKGHDDGIARIVIFYYKNRYSNNQQNYNLLLKIRNIIDSIIH